MNRFKKITKDIESFTDWIDSLTGDSSCNFCDYSDVAECGSKCKEGIKKYFEEEVE